MSKPIFPFDLSGKVCVIMGGTGLIGSECSRLCAAQGATVVIVGRDSKKGNELVESVVADGGKAEFEQCDTTVPAEVEKLVERVWSKYKKVDGLVNAAHFGTGQPGKSFTEVEYADFLSYLEHNIGGPFLATKEFAKKMILQKSGSIIFMGSIYGVKPPQFEIFEGTGMTVRAEYAMAKSSLITLSAFLAKWLGPSGIRVNAISPGAIFRNQDASFVEAYCKQVVLGGLMANPDDIAPTVAYLLSNASKYVTGQNIIVDGGWTL